MKIIYFILPILLSSIFCVYTIFTIVYTIWVLINRLDYFIYTKIYLPVMKKSETVINWLNKSNNALKVKALIVAVWIVLVFIFRNNETLINVIGISSLALYILIQSFQNKDGKVKVDVCIIPIIIIITSGVLSYHQQYNIEVKWSFMSVIFNKNDECIWVYLMPYITASVGWVTFWAFWAQIKANEIIKISEQKNRIETTFFKMLDIHRENIKDISIKNDKISGKDAIKELCKILNDAYCKSGVELKEFHNIYGYFFERDETCIKDLPTAKDVKEKLTIENECHSALATYSFHIYRLVKYILIQDDAVLNNKEKEQYMHIIRGQMTREEQLLLFYNWFAGYQRAIKNQRAFGSSWEETDKTAKTEGEIQTFLSDTKLLVYCNRELLIEPIKELIKELINPKHEYAEIVRKVLLK